MRISVLTRESMVKHGEWGTWIVFTHVLYSTPFVPLWNCQLPANQSKFIILLEANFPETITEPAYTLNMFEQGIGERMRGPAGGVGKKTP